MTRSASTTTAYRTSRYAVSSVGSTTHRRRRLGASVLAALGAVVLVLLAAPPAAVASPASVQKQEWWIERLGLEKSWQITQGAGQTVAVLDSGVDPSRGDLSGAIVHADVPGSTTSDPDPQKHGTQMASLIAGRGTDPGIRGVAPQAKILPVHSSGSGSTILWDSLNALADLPDPPQVVNMSLASFGACPDQLQAAVLKAVNRGIILVASAGNYGQSNSDATYPGDCTGVVAVGAVDYNGDAWPGSTRAPYVSLTAPGVNMIGFTSPTARFTGNGTSEASAIVSGTMALVRAHYPKLTARQIVTRVLYTTKQFESAQGTHNNTFGYGIVVTEQALKNPVPATAPNPIYDAVDKLNARASTGPSGPSTSGSTASRPPGVGTVHVTQAGSGSSGSHSNTGLLVGIGVVVVIAVGAGGVLLSRRGRRT